MKLQVIANTLDKIIKLGTSFIISIIAARYLVKDDFGIFVYISMLISSCVAITGAGLDTILTKKIAEKKRIDKSLFIAVLLVRFSIALVLALGVVMHLSNGKATDVFTLGAVFLLCCMATLAISESLLVSLLLNKQLLTITIIAFVIFSGGKVYLLIFLNSIEAKFLLDSLELLFIFIASFFVIKVFFSGSLSWLFVLQYIKELMKSALPLWLNGLVLIIYSRLDQLYVGQIGKSSDMAEYGISITINSLALIIPTAILSVIFPKMVTLYRSNLPRYQHQTIRLLRFAVIYGVLWIVCCHLFGEYFITLLYGIEYSYSAQYLNILSYGIVFIIIGQVAGQWVLIEGKYWISLKRSAVGIMVILLCYYIMGNDIAIKDIAYISLINLLTVNFIMYFCLLDTKSVREIFLRAIYEKDNG